MITLNFRGVALQRALFAEILKAGVPGLINSGITNLSVALLTGIACHLGREAAIGYAMGARLEYILLPIGFGFGTAISAMVGTNWGARQIAVPGLSDGRERPRSLLRLPPSEWRSRCSLECGWVCSATMSTSFGSAPAICKSRGRYTGFMGWAGRYFSSRRELEAIRGR
jgi:hypothetical protein